MLQLKKNTKEEAIGFPLEAKRKKRKSLFPHKIIKNLLEGVEQAIKRATFKTLKEEEDGPGAAAAILIVINLKLEIVEEEAEDEELPLQLEEENLFPFLLSQSKLHSQIKVLR